MGSIKRNHEPFIPRLILNFMLKRQRNFISLIISIIFSGLFSMPLSANETPAKDFILVIDPGHGGKDFGAVDNGTKEKDINLSVALKLKKLIDSRMKGAKVVLTRKDDTYLTLQQRADIANKSKGNLFISIHTNSVDKSNKNRKSIAGSSVYALGLHKDDNNMVVARRENSVIELESNYEQKYSGFDPSKDESYIIFEMAQKKNLNKSIKFADLAQKELVKSGRKNRGVHQAGFWVLWATSMPSVLVELDFICNPDAAKYLASQKGAEELAEALYQAVEAYEKDWRSMNRIDNSPAKTRAAATGEEVPKVVASSKSVVKKDSKASGDPENTVRTTAGKRRRRSEKGRESSISRNVETNNIPIHSSTDRLGKTVSDKKNLDLLSESSGDFTAEDKVKEKKEKKKGKHNKKEDKKKERPANSHNAKVEKVVTVYRIQVLASTELLKQNNPRFQGLSPITAAKEGKYYKYYYGESENQKEMAEKLAEVKKKIPDAFIVSLKKSKKRN